MPDIPGLVLRHLQSFSHPFHRMVLYDGAIIAFLTGKNSEIKYSSGTPAAI